MEDISDIRASDADRERAADTLRRHCSEGRLTLDELSDRLGEVYAARTLSDLQVPFRELPVLAVPPPEQVIRARPPQMPMPARHRRDMAVLIHLRVYLIVNLFLVLIWAVTGFGYFWPIWPILGWGVGVGCQWAATHGRTRTG